MGRGAIFFFFPSFPFPFSSSPVLGAGTFLLCRWRCNMRSSRDPSDSRWAKGGLPSLALFQGVEPDAVTPLEHPTIDHRFPYKMRLRGGSRDSGGANESHDAGLTRAGR